MSQAAIWHMIKRLDSTFDPGEQGHANFMALLKTMDALVEVREGEADLMVRLR